MVARGTTCILNAQIAGAVIVQRGAAIVIENSTISGSVTANGATGVRICGNAIAGSVTINGSTGFVVVGDVGDDQCAVNTIGGALTLRRNTAGVDAIGNAVTGATTATDNSGVGPSLQDGGPEIGGTPSAQRTLVLTAAVAASSATATAPPATPTWTVKAGDSLWAIADALTGDAWQYREIFALNAAQLTSPDALRIGMVLDVPYGVRS